MQTVSLIDALLLEPYPLDVWIAVRSDSAKGSGTEPDPWNGSPRYDAAFSVSTVIGSGRQATATTAVNHGYSNDQVVTIAGVTGTGAQYYSGTFVIYGVTPNSFNYWMAGDPGGSASGSITCARTYYRFDEIIATVPANTTVHLGPGLFLTRGYLDGDPPAIKSGQKFRGSGMRVTTVRLVNASVPLGRYGVIGSKSLLGELESFEVSDLTVDCNLDGQLIRDKAFLPIACCGILAAGGHHRYRRVRAINFGTLQYAPSASFLECFVLWSAGAYPGTSVERVDCVIEDCVVEQPALDQAWANTCLSMGVSEKGGTGIPDAGVMAYHRACVVRRCLVDCEFRDKPVAIESIGIPDANGVSTVTTRTDHGLAAGQWIRISGAVVAGTPHNGSDNGYNGSYPVNSINPGGNTRQFTYKPTNPVPTSAPTGDMWVGRFSSHLQPIAGLASAYIPSTGEYLVTLTTATAHFRVPGGNVCVNWVYTGTQQNPVWSPLFNGSFELKLADNTPWDPKTLKYRVSSDPGAPLPGNYGCIGVVFNAISNDGGTAAVVEGNRILNTWVGGPYNDTWSSRDLIVRNNYYRNVVTGPYLSMGGNGYPILVASLTHGDPDAYTAKLTTAVPHGFTAGQAVRIKDVRIPSGDPPLHSYNDPYKIAAVAADKTWFTYRERILEPTPSPDRDPSPPCGKSAGA